MWASACTRLYVCLLLFLGCDTCHNKFRLSIHLLKNKLWNLIKMITAPIGHIWEKYTNTVNLVFWNLIDWCYIFILFWCVPEEEITFKASNQVQSELVWMGIRYVTWILLKQNSNATNWELIAGPLIRPYCSHSKSFILS